MQAQAPILPLLIPFLAALLQLAWRRMTVQRVIGLGAGGLLVAVTGWLAVLADDGMLRVYALGDWPAPYGIVLVVDRLAAAMVLLTAVLGLLALLAASSGFDDAGQHFHPLFQLQLFGLCGAFLTGDLFNLFVFFEVMLLASYALLAHGGGLARTRAGLGYVVLNLVGSAIFLIGLGLLYGTMGTLNLAHLAQRLVLSGGDQGLVRLALMLLVVVFALKAGLLPLCFWLPHTYAAAGVPVAALFAIMTKVGIVALLRLQTVALDPALPDLLKPWLPVLAMATIALAAVGVVVATRLQALAAWLVLLSAGTLLIVPAQASVAVDAAAIYYLVQSTLAGAAFFLLAGAVAEQRGEAGDRFASGAPPATWLSLCFLVAAVSVAGLPPFSGFIAKVMLLGALRGVAGAPALWTVLLAASFLVMIALARNGCLLVWKHQAMARPAANPLPPTMTVATLLLVAAGPLLAVVAEPLAAYAGRAASQLHSPGAYVASVLGQAPRSRLREVR